MPRLFLVPCCGCDLLLSSEWRLLLLSTLGMLPCGELFVRELLLFLRTREEADDPENLVDNAKNSQESYEGLGVRAQDGSDVVQGETDPDDTEGPGEHYNQDATSDQQQGAPEPSGHGSGSGGNDGHAAAEESMPAEGRRLPNEAPNPFENPGVSKPLVVYGSKVRFPRL